MTRVATGEVIPLAVLPEDWFYTYMKLTSDQSDYVLLESGRGGRYSVIGLEPFAKLTGKNGLLRIEQEGQVNHLKGPLLHSLRQWASAWAIEADPDLPDMQGGLFGQLSYDLIREIESLPVAATDDLDTPDVSLLAFDELYVIDHQEELLWGIAVTEDRADHSVAKALLDRWHYAAAAWDEETFSASRNTIDSDQDRVRSLDEKTFNEGVRRVQDYIRSGDVFQVNLSVRETMRLNTPPRHMYQKLREINPSPYMGYFQKDGIVYVSASPELLVKVRGEDVSTRPIAGTRSRGDSPQEDDRLARTLLDNEKERAEHIMLVDLERNDLGRIAAFGTVMVDELMVIEKYSHVQHIVSNVRGKRAPGRDAFDVIAATFPGGTITGAPKIRTMEIIEEIEPVRRGAYTGAMGWIGFQDDMELNITIRTMIVKDDEVHVQAGAGIVIDSDPAAEYKESLKKAKALWHAKTMSEEELVEELSKSRGGENK
ncbi:anthranilate synthase component I family protein [Salisediminibacterium beveridgei]|uniref:Para-aminobenzoate synthase, aminase component n=1 Tax=Salisediminibacterium beveridgei TaxID=632773 RepID=A0A1D7R017_9BACI|nr:anthranilate synthase component I family protein [Salisediminibacterium beveridgei]AOM84606.1 Para-aminobenzoate synthase, aminase component [Salisediminibacterium beveridgei]